jgi:autotransporter-associated beta strand protein
MIRSLLSLRSRSLTALALLLTCAASLAQSWTGAGDGVSFNDSVNWTVPVIPGSVPQFNSLTPLSLTQNSGSPLPIYALIQNAAGTGVTIGGNPLQFNNPSSYINNAPAAPITLNVPVFFTSDLVIYGNLVMNNGLTGPGGLSVGGTLNLNAAGSFSAVQLQAGATLRAGAAGAFGSASINLAYNSSLVEFATPSLYNFSGTFTGGNSAIVRQAGLGSVQFNTASISYSGAVQVAAGTLRATVPYSLGNASNTSVLSSGTLRLAGTDGFTGTSITIAPGGTLNGGGLAQNTFVSVVNDGLISLPAGSLLNAGGFTIWTGSTSGAGALGLGGFFNFNTGANLTHTGGTTIAGGNVLINTPNALPDSGALVQNAGYLQQPNAETVDTITLVNGTQVWGNLTATSIDLQAGVLNANGTVTSAPITKTTAGTVSLGGNMVAPGGVVVSAGNLDIAGNITAPVTNNAALNLNYGSLSGTVVNNGSMTLLNGTVASNISGPNGLSIANNAYVAMTGTNSYGGGTTVGTGAFVSVQSSAVQGNWSVGLASEVVFSQTSPGSTSASFSGAGKVVVQQSAFQLDLNGASTHAGGVETRQNSHLGIGHDNALGTGTLSLETTAAFTTKLTAVGGNRTLANALQFSTGNMEVTGANDLAFTHTGAKQLSSTGSITHNATGVTTIAGTFLGQNTTTINVNAGKLVLGAAVNNGFRMDGTLNVASGALLEMISNSPVKLGPTSLNGGTLKALNGVAVPTGLALNAAGTIIGRVSSEAGSLIEATGPLTMGDSTSFAGFFSNGELRTQQHTVTIADKNQAVLGSLTEVGTTLQSGVITAANGVFVDFGRAITGWGTINSTNAPAQATIINGDAAGSAVSQPLDFTGFVKGVGTFTDVTFSGTFSPGLSPAIVPVNNVSLGGSSILIMEIGGLTPGSMHDQLDIGGTLALNGTLDIDLINGFNPAYGNIFNILDGTTTGTFSSYSFPGLAPGLTWDTSDLYSLGNLKVVPEPSTGLLAALAAGLLARRRRQHPSGCRQAIQKLMPAQQQILS